MLATDLNSLLLAGGCIVGATAAGALLRLVFQALARRAALTKRDWDDLGWGLLKNIALPAGVVSGLWGAMTVLQPEQPMRGIANRILLAMIVLSVSQGIARLATDIVRSLTVARTGSSQSATIFVHLIRIAIVAVGILVLLQSFGIAITPVLTALGVGGLAVALALQDTLSNLFAGVQVLASNKVQPGDYIRLDNGEDGYVVDINWRNTTIEKLAGNIVIVPNSRLADAIITNFHQPVQDMAVRVQLGVSYDSDLEHVEDVTVEVARKVMASVKGSVPEHEPFVRYHTFADYSINFTVILRVSEYTDQYLVVHEFIKQLHQRYRDEGITIPFPMRTVLFKPDPDTADAVPHRLPQPVMIRDEAAN